MVQPRLRFFSHDTLVGSEERKGAMANCAVNFQFNTEEWNQMAAEQRVARCTIFAEEAVKHSQAAADEHFKAIYLEIAFQWLALADEINKTLP